MIYTSLAVLALSASTAVSPLSKLVHFHPHSAQPDTRITLTLRNDAPVFQDVKIAGRSYTILAHQAINIKAPAGTVVYADSTTGTHRRGDVLVEISSQVQDKMLDLQ
jgi:ABC-type transporter Mla subunit MlaD